MLSVEDSWSCVLTSACLRSSKRQAPYVLYQNRNIHPFTIFAKAPSNQLACQLCYEYDNYIYNDHDSISCNVDRSYRHHECQYLARVGRNVSTYYSVFRGSTLEVAAISYVLGYTVYVRDILSIPQIDKPKHPQRTQIGDRSDPLQCTHPRHRGVARALHSEAVGFVIRRGWEDSIWKPSRVSILSILYTQVVLEEVRIPPQVLAPYPRRHFRPASAVTLPFVYMERLHSYHRTLAAEASRAAPVPTLLLVQTRCAMPKLPVAPLDLVRQPAPCSISSATDSVLKCTAP